MWLQVVEVEAPDDEEEGEDYEAGELDGSATDDVNERNCGPVSGNGTRADQDSVSGCEVVKVGIHESFCAGSVADGGKHSCSVETETVEGDLNQSQHFLSS